MTRFPEKIKACVLLIILLVEAVACTIKEDREPCPCYLDVDYATVIQDKVFGKKEGVVDVAVFNPEESCLTTFNVPECPQLHENVVERGFSQVIGVVHNRPLVNFLEKGHILKWAAGNEIDSVYVHASEVDCRGEEAYCLLQPHKQFHTIFLTDEFEGMALREYNLVVRGSTCGFDAAAENFEAIEGEYLYTVQEYDRDGGISVRVPRQINNDLRLEMWTKDDYRRVFIAPIGQYMNATGYDKQALDLVDFDIKINFRDALIYVRVADWDDELVFTLFE